MDILAWFIIAIFASLVGLPAIASFISGDHFISYKDAWLIGHGIVLFLALFGAVMFGIIWAFERVLW